MGGLGAPELIIILVVVLLLFGTSRLPKLARSLGQASNEFKRGVTEGAKEDAEEQKKKDAESEPAGRNDAVSGVGAGVVADGAEAALAGDAAPLPLRRPAPHPVVDAVGEGVLQARHPNRTFSAYCAGSVHAHPVARKERRGRELAALASGHPVRIPVHGRITHRQVPSYPVQRSASRKRFREFSGTAPVDGSRRLERLGG
jgi:sec-independent protein translocase protein TatA